MTANNIKTKLNQTQSVLSYQISYHHSWTVVELGPPLAVVSYQNSQATIASPHESRQ
jgi:hypothetical protein